VLIIKTGGGVAIFIQDYLSFTIRTDFDDIMSDCIETAFVDISDGASCKYSLLVLFIVHLMVTCWT